ncbi:MAG: isoprenylcysteine carboxylmethyltransferase family protein [Candidatus Paceibacterota bacterium]|jgi:protein-S-isoprenylcysteine O-methyltransferase Ste14
MESNNKDSIQKQNIHKILAHSHATQLVLFLFAVFLDIVFSIKIFTDSTLLTGAGVVFLIFGSALIFWAQYTSHHLPDENITKESFSHGPYHYVRNPTNLGIFLMVVGFGIIANSFFVIFFALISSLVVKFAFLEKEEKILTAKYGEPYLEYIKSVKL